MTKCRDFTITDEYIKKKRGGGVRLSHKDLNLGAVLPLMLLLVSQAVKPAEQRFAFSSFKCQ